MTKISTLSNAIRHSLLLSTLVAGSAFAQEQEQEQQAAESNESIDRIEVTGSRISRADFEGAQQLVVLSAEDMQAEGNVTVFDALTNLAQNGAFQFEGPESQLFTPNVQTLNLRGIGVGNTLVLLNGRRAANYPAPYQSATSVFNFGSIPIGAVDRIEVLASGASAIYGSDAIAGVINIILKKDVDETSLDYMYGTPTESKSAKSTNRLQLLTGSTFENGNFTAVLEYQKRDGILASDYDQYDDSQLDYPYAEENGDAYRSRINLDLRRWNSWTPDDTYLDPGGQAACDAVGNGTVYSYRPNAGNFCGYNSAGDVNFRNETEQLSGLFSGNYELDDVRLFADVMVYTSDSRSNNGLSPYVSEEILHMDEITPNPFFGQWYEWTVRQRAFTEEELQMSMDETYEETSFTVTFGAEGEWGEFYWDAYATHSYYELESERPWWKAQEYFDTFLGDVAPVFGGVSFFGDNWYTGEGAFGIRYNTHTPITDENRHLITNALGKQTYGNETSSTSLGFNLSGDLMQLPAGPLSFALAAEYEKQDFEFIPDELLQQDAPIPNTTGSGWYQLTGYNGGGDRTRTALGLELRAPVTDTFTVNAAARVDSYDNDSSSIGTRVTPSASVEWRPVEQILVRAGYTESFRAPDLNYVYTETGFYTGTTDYVSCYQQFQATGSGEFNREDCEGSSSFVKRVGAQSIDPDAEGLKDETGSSYWYGIAYDVTDELSFTVDYTKMELEDKVTTESIQGLLDDEFECYMNTGNVNEQRCDYVARRLSRVTNEETGISYVDTFNATPINQSAERSEYLDASMNYATQTAYGDLGVSMNYSHMLSYEEKLTADSDWVDLRDDPFLGGWVPRSTWTGSFSWSQDVWRTALSFNRMGSTTVYNPYLIEEGEEDRVSPWIRWNLTGSYDFTEDLRVTLSVVNLFDAEAPKDSTIGPTAYPWYNVYVYSGAGIGREAFLNLNYRF
ncbi:TonB-dependent receptor plug domain-containing protein [Thalassotalea maritima]|uniref:TonB-dependent receptor plug domain-containing protein n=1 Tax=Thalassotalea maritima TaxID=3242416 RepID=UPI0035272CE4